MAKEMKKPGRGRPRLAKPMTSQLNVRIDPELREAIDRFKMKYEADMELREVSDAVRHLLKRALRAEGLL